MFAALKRKLVGDKRPIRRRVENAVLGPLIYSDDDEAWLTDENTTHLKFGFYICGSEDYSAAEQMPDPALVRQAESVVLAKDSFVAQVRAYVQHEAQTKSLHRGWQEEICELQVETLCLFWPKRPRDGQISFSGGRNFRLWRCGYIDGEPGGGLGFDS